MVKAGKSISIILMSLLGTVFCSAAAAQTVCDSAAVTLTLEDCISMAQSENVNVKNAYLDYMSAKMVKREALTHYFPTANIIALGFNAIDPLINIGMSDFLGSSDLANEINYYLETTANISGLKTSYETMRSAYGAVVNVTQPLFAGGRIVNGNKLASLGVQAASLSESIAHRDVAIDIEKKYTLVISLQEKMKVLDSGIALTDSLYKDAMSAYKSGIIAVSDTKEVEIARDDLKSKKIRLKGGIMLARMDLCNAIGLDYSKASKFTLALSDSTCLAPSNYYMDPTEAVMNLQEAKLLNMSVEQKQLEKKMARGEAMPEIGIGALYGYGRLIGSSPTQNGMVYASIKIPLTDWSVASSKMKNIDYQLQKANNQRDYLCSMLELQIRQLWVEVESTWEELQLMEEKVAQAQDILHITKGNVAAGMETWSTLMEKQVTLNNAECDRIDARIAYMSAVSAFQSKCRQ